MSNWEETSLPCPCGKSSDAYAINSEGDGHCFSCGEHFFNSEKDTMTTLTGDDIVKDFYPNRGLSRNTLEHYNVVTKFKDGVPKQTGYSYPNGAVKIRNLESKSKSDRFFSEGPMSDATLFGMNKFDKNSRDSITITEGEVDALSIAQTTGFTTAAVSVRNATTAKGDCIREYDYINSFKKIILCFDNDDAGTSAMKEVSSLFDFKKVYICKLTKYKDANGYLCGEEDTELFKAWRGAKRYTPDNIISSFNEIEKSLEESKEDLIATYPFKGLNDNLWGLFRGEVIVLKGASGIGKQLCNTTLIPTPNGWTTMGEINVGDIIYGANGKKTKVTYVTGDQFVECYKVSFSDGTSIVAGGPHKWGVIDKRGDYFVKTTDEIISEGVRDTNSASRYGVPIAKAVEGHNRKLSIDPYYLGYWLGDGHSYSADISIGYDDYQYISEEFKGSLTFSRESRTCMTVRTSKVTHKMLASLGVIKNKHIPQEYLRSSIKNRKKLIQGLMDSDGSVHQNSCEFYTSSEKLKDGFLELARSLGYVCRLRTKQSKLYGVSKKIAYTVRFMVNDGYEVFTMRRKAGKAFCVERDRLTKKFITSIEETDTVPSRCITVDNPDHLYICDKGWTVTHNTEIFRAMEHHILKTTNSPIGLLHLEEDNGTTVKAIATYELQQPVIIPDSIISNAEVLNAYKKAVNGDDSRVYIHSSFDVENEEEFINNIRFLVSACGCEVIFFDHITWLATGGNNDDERKKLDRISQKLKLLAKELRFCLVMISHTNDDGKTRGSRNIVNVANTIIHMHRDTTAESLTERKRTYLTIEKARLGGRTGPIGYVQFDSATHTLKDEPDEGPLS